MMREIVFRGKRIDNGKWVEGLLSSPCEIREFYGEPDQFSDWCIHPDTVGQYTGIKDVNGNRIFEGDLVKVFHDHSDEYNDTHPVRFFDKNDYPAFDLEGWRGESNGLSEVKALHRMEVIDNIHDNPTLLENK